MGFAVLYLGTLVMPDNFSVHKICLAASFHFAWAPVIIFVLMFPAVLAGQDSRLAAQLTAPANVSDRDLHAFAKVYVRYHQIRDSYARQIAQTQDSKEKARLEKEGNAEVKSLLDSQGLTVAAYNEILATLNSNTALRQKALQLVEQERRS